MKFSKGSLAGPDDPIFKEGPTFYTRKSDRASTPSTPITSPTGISAHLGRLAGIAVAEPELREAIDQYTAALRSVPAFP